MPIRNFRFDPFPITPPTAPSSGGTGDGSGSGDNSGGGSAPAVGVVTSTDNGLMSPELLAKVNAAETATAQLTQGHNAQESTLTGLSQSLTQVIETIGFHGEHLENLDTLLEGYTSNMLALAQHGQDLSTLSSSYSTLSGTVTALTNAQNSLSITIASHGNALTAHGEAISDLDDAVNALDTALGTTNNALTTAQQTLTSHGERLTALEQAPPGGGPAEPVAITTVESATAVYSFVKTDTTKFYRVTTSVAANWTVDPEASRNWEDGDELHVKNLGPENLTILSGSGVTVNLPAGSTNVLAAGAVALLRKTATADVWDLMGQTNPTDPFDPASKVDVVPGKGLSEADFTAVEKTKLAGLAQSDWNATSGQPGHILNKPAGLGGMTMAEMRYDWMDFSASAAPWTGAAISSGTVTNAFSAAMVTADPDFYGVILIRCTAVANTGYRITNSNTQMMAAPGMHFTARFMIPIAGMATAWAIMGLHDATAYADPVDGVYLKLSGTTCNFVASQNSVRTTGASFTIANLKWYTLHIDVISSTEVRFSLRNDTDEVLVFAETLTTNIPAANATRALGAGVVAVGSHLAVADVLALDWIGCGPQRPSAFGAMI